MVDQLEIVTQQASQGQTGSLLFLPRDIFYSSLLRGLTCKAIQSLRTQARIKLKKEPQIKSTFVLTLRQADLIVLFSRSLITRSLWSILSFSIESADIRE